MDIEQLISSYLDGDLSSEQEGEFHHLLSVSPEARALFREHLALHTLARDERVLYRPSEEMRSALFARLTEEEGMPLAGAAPILESREVTDGHVSAPLPIPSLSHTPRRTAVPEMRGPVASSESEEMEEKRRKRRIIPFLIPMMVLVLGIGTMWYTGLFDGSVGAGGEGNETIAMNSPVTSQPVEKGYDPSAGTTPPAAVEQERPELVENIERGRTDRGNSAAVQRSVMPDQSISRPSVYVQPTEPPRQQEAQPPVTPPAPTMAQEILSRSLNDYNTEETPPFNFSLGEQPLDNRQASDFASSRRDEDVDDYSVNLQDTESEDGAYQGYYNEPSEENDVLAMDDGYDNSPSFLSDSVTSTYDYDDGVEVAPMISVAPSARNDAAGRGRQLQLPNLDELNGVAITQRDSLGNPLPVMRADAPAVMEIMRNLGLIVDTNTLMVQVPEGLWSRNGNNGGDVVFDNGSGPTPTSSLTLPPLDTEGENAVTYPQIRSGAVPPASVSADTVAPVSVAQSTANTKPATEREPSLTPSEPVALRESPLDMKIDADERSALLPKWFVGGSASWDVASLSRSDESVSTFMPSNNFANDISTVMPELQLKGGMAIDKKGRHHVMVTVGLLPYGERSYSRDVSSSRNVSSVTEPITVIDALGNITSIGTVTRNRTVTSTKEEVTDVSRIAYEFWGGVGYRLDVELTRKFSGGIEAWGGIGRTNLHAGITLPLTYQIARNLRIEITPGLRYRSAYGSSEPATTGTYNPSASSSAFSEEFNLPLQESQLSFGAGIGLILPLP